VLGVAPVEFTRVWKMPFTFHRLEIPDVILIEAKPFTDSRGFFAETYKQSEFANNGIAESFVQDNQARSKRGVLRGLHYQKRPAAQSKLLSVVSGEIYDVAVDIRNGSPSFGRCVAQILSGDNHQLLYIPEGFAHGYLVMSEEADVVYKVTSEYSPENERGIIWNDPQLAIQWPINSPILSSQDIKHPVLADADNDFVYGK
jgi:dTDP-4-dehydrorhamnose 3,5-epimerase